MFKGYLYIILSAVIYGCMPMAAKFIYADGGVLPVSRISPQPAGSADFGASGSKERSAPAH